ncbi:MAG: YbdK family carboxylate-amine ligase [Gemmatimonadetes bacterium]|nr:YbdK family carboxylate-amine ligase [Gemmatimonadota bacterium]
MAVSVTPADFTVGVEEEYQLVDPRGGALRSRARTVLANDWTGDIKPEMLASSIEVGTCVCYSAEELRAELSRLRLEAAVAAEAVGLRIVATGTHPYAPQGGQEFNPGKVYERLRDEYRSLAYHQSIFGLHVHVAIPQSLDRVRLMNAVRQYLPHILALSASSPLNVGEDTGYASFRSILWRRWPRSGPPPRLRDEEEYRRIVDDLVRTEWIDAAGRIYWEIRPHHVYPTLEFRVADVTPRIDDALVIASLIRALVVAAAEGVVTEPRLPIASQQVLLVENGWKASRDGTDAEFLEEEGDTVVVRPARASLLELVGQLSEISERLGDGDSLALLPELLERGDAAQRIRRKAVELGNAPAEVMHWLAEETVLGLGLDRRMEQRDE